ncbi:Riboflavin kinase [Penicillium subrubescens]|uniref:Riboflavin kinase n=1 Tax=Penicillium subrubescens TaxID=1316194 RepID=A0A1Q5UQZ9_9EURO|nr:Riboflavin kinase [Penicillium subrubescens]KAJ5896073.1 Riboflavin kinase [Penicillium subrubescens]OKP14900.1 Riboflavin kinase [Penicillium subrubescens]
MRPDKPRDPVAGPDAGPESPYPVRLSGPVIKGFGRGSKDLGIPTANIPADDLSEQHPELTSGVYYGVVALDPQNLAQGNGAEKSSSATLLPAVLSIGYNPFYKNTVRSVEIHIMPPLTQPSPTAVAHPKFNRLPDFYGTKLNLLILGYIRPEFDYVSLDALIEDIRIDCEVARQSLLRDAYQRYIVDDGKASAQVNEDRKWLVTFEGVSENI